MKKAVWSAAAVAAFFAFASPASAQTTQAIQATVTVGNQARLTVTGGPVSIPDADPDTVLTIPATGSISISARARVAPAASVSVTVQAGDAHFDADDTIPVANLSWGVTGAAFLPGTMSTSAVDVAAWTGPASQNGTQSYSLANSWSYAPGVHSVTLTYTLVTP